MIMKRTWAGLLALTLLVGIAPQIAKAAVKAGATCTKLKSTTTVSGYKYTCIKSGKKLVWSKGIKVVATPKPTATPSVTATPAPTPTPSVTATPAPTPTPSVTATPAPTPTPSASATPTPTPSASASQASTVTDKYSDQPCETEGEDLQYENASYKCIKRSDSGVLLWSKNNAPVQTPTPSPSATPSSTATPSPSATPAVTPVLSSRGFVDLHQNEPCEIEGDVFVGTNAQYKCIKRPDSGKLILSMNNGRPNPAPSPLLKPAATIPSNLSTIQKSVNTLSMDSSVCKIKEKLTSSSLPNATAFPFRPTVIKNKGKLNVAVVYVDWADSPGTDDDSKFYQEQIKLLKDFYWMVSENTLDINPTFSKKWFRISGSYKDFITKAADEAQTGPAPKKQKFYDAAVAASDAETNYSGIDVVIFAIPKGKKVFAEGLHEFNFIYNGYLKTAEGNIYDIVAAGDSFLIPTYLPPWLLYAHEMGHMIGTPHQADESFNSAAPSEKYQQNPLGGWDIMSSQYGSSRTITSWLRWVAGWLKDEQVLCSTKEAITENYFELKPINSVSGGVESLVIKLNDSKVLVVESRRFDSNFDVDTGNSKDGVLVYLVDSLQGSAEGNQILLSPRNISKYIYEEKLWWDWKELDAIFFQGDSVIYEGLKIEVFYSGKDSDIVKVSKVG
jgi:M6 family metalloprotease-like protein